MADFAARLNQAHGTYTRVQQEAERLTSEITQAEALTSSLGQAQAVLTKLGEFMRRRVQERVEGIVTVGLQQTISDRYKFVFSTEVKHNQVEMRPVILYRHGEVWKEMDPQEDNGGGIVVLVAFLLNVSVLIITKPRLRRLMVLDESFAQLSAEYLPNLGSLLKELSEKAGIQFVIISHQPEISAYADKVYQVRKVNGESQALPVGA